MSIKNFFWMPDLGSLCHFGLGFMGGFLGFAWAALFTGAFAVVEILDYFLRLERVIEGTDTKPETWERTKQEFFEYFLGLIIGAVI